MAEIPRGNKGERRQIYSKSLFRQPATSNFVANYHVYAREYHRFLFIRTRSPVGSAGNSETATLGQWVNFSSSVSASSNAIYRLERSCHHHDFIRLWG